jgi:hypothetical protein
MKYQQIIWVLAVCCFAACSDSPKVIEKVSSTEDQPTATAAAVTSEPKANGDMHEVVAVETLDAQRYTYVLVEESGDQFWIAVPRSDVEIGQTYYYSGGLLKRNFRSQEFDREFETIYLVSGLMQRSSGKSASAVDRALGETSDTRAQADHVHSSENSVSLEELFTNKEQYDGKVIEVTGECVKINKQIMGRNWVHIQDGTGGDKPYDLTVTTSADIPVGAVVTLRGKIALNRDFGSGYRYDIIMEDAHTH